MTIPKTRTLLAFFMILNSYLHEKEIPQDNLLLNSKEFDTKPVVPERCQGLCTVINMDLKPNSSWTG